MSSSDKCVKALVCFSFEEAGRLTFHGSGFFVSSRHILTAAHLFYKRNCFNNEPIDEFGKIVISGGIPGTEGNIPVNKLTISRAPEYVQGEDKRWIDVCLLSLPTEDQNQNTYLELAHDAIGLRSKQVELFAFQLDANFKEFAQAGSAGMPTVSFQPNNNEHNVLVHNHQHRRGSSGGAVIFDGKVVGVISQAHRDDNFGTAEVTRFFSKWLSDQIESVDINTVPSMECPVLYDHISPFVSDIDRNDVRENIMHYLRNHDHDPSEGVSFLVQCAARDSPDILAWTCAIETVMEVVSDAKTKEEALGFIDEVGQIGKGALGSYNDANREFQAAFSPNEPDGEMRWRVAYFNAEHYDKALESAEYFDRWRIDDSTASVRKDLLGTIFLITFEHCSVWKKIKNFLLSHSKSHPNCCRLGKLGLITKADIENWSANSRMNIMGNGSDLEAQRRLGWCKENMKIPIEMDRLNNIVDPLYEAVSELSQQ